MRHRVVSLAEARKTGTPQLVGLDYSIDAISKSSSEAPGSAAPYAEGATFTWRRRLWDSMLYDHGDYPLLDLRRLR